MFPPPKPDDDNKPRHLMEDLFIIVCILCLWPVILNWTHPLYEILLYCALVGLIIILVRRIRRFRQARDELEDQRFDQPQDTTGRTNTP